MKYIFLFLATIYSLSGGYCFEGPKIDSRDKTYVQPEQIAFSGGGIFVLLGNAWLATESIHADASGMYVTTLADSKFFGWKCPRCGHENSSLVNMCEKCGYR